MASIPLPPYTRTKRLKTDEMAFFFEVPTKYRKARCPIQSEALGQDPARALARGQELAKAIQAWRSGEPSGPVYGTVAWLIRDYQRSDRYRRLAARTQRGYDQCATVLDEQKLETRRFGEMPALKVRPKHADRLHEEIGKRGIPTANACMRFASVLWGYGKRKDVVSSNPFEKMMLPKTGGNTIAWTRQQYRAFVDTADRLDPDRRDLFFVGTAAVLMFELAQRESDVLAFPWNSYRPGRQISIKQGKTGRVIWLPLQDEDGPLFPEIEERLAGTPKRGALVIMRWDWRKKAWVPYDEHLLRKHVRRIRAEAGLPSGLVFMGLRHGGLTELGDSDVTEQQAMSHSGHTTPTMLRAIYSKRSREQAALAAVARHMV